MGSTMPTGYRPCRARGWFVILRFYSPTATFFDKSWRPGEIERVWEHALIPSFEPLR
jgi:hypothetical protein